MRETVKRLNWGILGTGSAAQLFADGLKSLPAARLLAVGSRGQATADRFAHKNGIPRAYGGYERLVADGEIDIVYIATPNTLHRENSVACLTADKAVLCEKPFAVNAQEAREVVALARDRNLFCMEAMWTRFLPIMHEVRRIVASGALGEIRMMTADLGMRIERDRSTRHFDPDLGGGALLDLGCYPISLAYFLFGPPASIRSMPTMGEVDEQAAVLLGYPSGSLAVLHASLSVSTPGELVIMGTLGRLKIHAPLYRPSRCTVTACPPVTGDAGRNAATLRTTLKSLPLARKLLGLLPRPAGRSREIVVPHEGNGYNYEAAEVMKCIRSGTTESGLMPLDETVSILETMDSIRADWGLRCPGEPDRQRT